MELFELCETISKRKKKSVFQLKRKNCLLHLWTSLEKKYINKTCSFLLDILSMLKDVIKNERLHGNRHGPLLSERFENS